MSPKNYLKVISDHKVVVIVCVILVGLLASIFTQLVPKSYDATLTLSVHRINREKTEDFQYDNYYAIQAAELLTDTIVNWLATPDVAIAIYDKAGITPDVEGFAKLSRKFRARQLSSHVARVWFNYKDQEGTDKLAASLVGVVQDRVKNIEKTFQNKPSFGIQTSSPIVVQHKIDPILAGVCGLVSGLLVGIGLAFLFEYFRRE